MSNTPGRGAEREGGGARSCAATLSPRRVAQVRARFGGRGPLPQELGSGWGLSPAPAAVVTIPPSSVSAEILASSSLPLGHPAPV